MIIEGERELYKVDWTVDMIGYGHPTIRASRKWFFGFLTRWKTLRVCDNGYHNWDTQLPSETKRVFDGEVAKFETYITAWEEEHAKENIL